MTKPLMTAIAGALFCLSALVVSAPSAEAAEPVADQGRTVPTLMCLIEGLCF